MPWPIVKCRLTISLLGNICLLIKALAHCNACQWVFASWWVLVHTLLASLEWWLEKKNRDQAPELVDYALMWSSSPASHQSGHDSSSPIAVEMAQCMGPLWTMYSMTSDGTNSVNVQYSQYTPVFCESHIRICVQYMISKTQHLFRWLIQLFQNNYSPKCTLHT